MRVTCPNCGSDQIMHAAKYIVRNRVTKWSDDGHGNWEPVEFGEDQVLSDSHESVDYPYDCLACAEIEMVESDLLYDGAHHPDWVEGENHG